MPRCLVHSKWLRFLALVHVLARSSGFSFLCNSSSNLSSLRLQGQRVCQQHGFPGGALRPARAGSRRLGGSSWRRQPWRERGLRMAELYRGDDAEAKFYAQRLQDLITAYAIKTAHYYWLELRGNMYAEWLTRYIKDSGGIETVGSHEFLSGMLRAPPEDIIVKKLIKSPRGGSGNNPFLTGRKPVEYKETIEPTSIARQLMDIREQMAEQLCADLRQIAAENDKLRRNYADEAELGPDRAQELQLSIMEPMLEVDPSSGMANPPQRRAAYRRAIELVTAASMGRVKSEMRIRGDRKTLEWLDRFSERELDQRGNALISALFAGPMVLINEPGRARPKVIEPLKVALEIMQGREAVAEELIAVLEKVPQDHLRMTVSLLNEKWASPGDSDAGEPDARES